MIDSENKRRAAIANHFNGLTNFPVPGTANSAMNRRHSLGGYRYASIPPAIFYASHLTARYTHVLVAAYTNFSLGARSNIHTAARSDAAGASNSGLITGG